MTPFIEGIKSVRDAKKGLGLVIYERRLLFPTLAVLVDYANEKREMLLSHKL